MYVKPALVRLGNILMLAKGREKGDVYEEKPTNETLRFYNPWS